MAHNADCLAVDSLQQFRAYFACGISKSYTLSNLQQNSLSKNSPACTVRECAPLPVLDS